MIEKKRIDSLINDIEYLKYEAQSLNKVIESVPYSEKPLDGASIVEIFLSIDSIQCKVLDILNRLTDEGTDITIRPDELYQRIELDTQKLEEIKFSDVILEIEDNRLQLCSKIEKQTSHFFEVELNLDSGKISMFNLLSTMVKKERALLKEVADLVLTFQTDKHFQRKVASQKLNMS